jgi:protein involved in polysaccharide export with SLBB domain
LTEPSNLLSGIDARMRLLKNSSAIRSVLLSIGLSSFVSILALAQSASPAQSLDVIPDGAPAVAAGRYVLQVGDEISIKVFRNSDLDDNVKIGPDECISLMFFQNVKVAGMTVEKLGGELTRRYAKYIRDPVISVVVRNFANQRIFVGGEVEHPGLLPISGKLTVLGAVVQAGGFKATARMDNVILLRNSGNEQAVAMKLNVKEMMKGDKPDIPLQSFDLVYVPLSKIARMDRFVDQYLRQTIPVLLTSGFTYLLSPNSSVIRFQ